MNMKVNGYIDHTVLKPTTQAEDVSQLCHEAYKYDFAAVCVPPNFVSHAKTYLKDSKVNIATVVGFPFGYSCIAAKAAETLQAIKDGATEIDMVANISAIKAGNQSLLSEELKAVQSAIANSTGSSATSNAALKVIIESGILTDDEIIMCCKLYGAMGIDFLKTSTGYAEKGASIHAVRLFRQHLPAAVKIKASGGIRSYETAVEMIEVGADRIGCSAGVTIVTEQAEIMRRSTAVATRSTSKGSSSNGNSSNSSNCSGSSTAAVGTATPAKEGNSRTPSRSSVKRAAAGAGNSSFSQALSAFQQREERTATGSKRSSSRITESQAGDAMERLRSPTATPGAASRGTTPAAKRAKLSAAADDNY